MQFPGFTSTDIHEAEQAVLGSNRFNADQIRFIMCMTSVDLDACPGSGKTAALIAKIYLLAKHRIWEKGMGICVLSHTNVAVDEIKTKIALKYPEALDYPNFIGTLQEFVNTFLTIPYYKGTYSATDITIDNAHYIEQVRSLLRLRHMLDPVEGKLQAHGLEGLLTSSVFDPSYISNPQYFTLANKDGSPNKVTQAMLDVRKMLAFKRGYLTFRDAFILADNFIERTPDIGIVLRSRFSHVFLDEAQDTDGCGLLILEKIFRDFGCCYQRIGDPQQDIYDSAKGDVRWSALTGSGHLTLPKTNRFGPKIAKAVSYVRTVVDAACAPIESGKNSQVDDCYLIAFDERQPNRAVETFSDLVSSTRVPMIDVRAVGTYAKERTDLSKLSITSYWPGYSKAADIRISSKQASFKEPWEYITSLTKEQIVREGTSLVHNRIVQLIRRSIREQTGLYLTYSSMRDALLPRWRDLSEVVFYVTETVVSGNLFDFKILSSNLTHLAMHVATKPVRVEIPSIHVAGKREDIPVPGNKVFYGEVEIEFGTVHSVKGLTVDALLLLTCQFRSLSAGPPPVGTELDYLVKTSSYINRRRLIYVAMSRPRYVFAWAVPVAKFGAMPQDLVNCFTVISAT